MPTELDTHIKFNAVLREVDELILCAESNQSSEILYAACCKSALLLLAGKFESFVESIAAEYVDEINALSLPASAIPTCLRLNHSMALVDKLNKGHDASAVYCKIGELWNSAEPFNTLQIACKFSYGKHGEAEMIKLFKSIGVEDVFGEVKVNLPQESLIEADGVTDALIDFKGIFNSVTNMRNNILHQDASPNLTTESLKQDRAAYGIFATEAGAVLNAKLKDIQADYSG